MADLIIHPTSNPRLARWRIGRLVDALALGFIVVYALFVLVWLVLGLLPVIVRPWPGLRALLGDWGPMGWSIVIFSYANLSLPSVLLQYGFSFLNLGLAIFLVWLRPFHLAARLLALGMLGTAAVFNLHAHIAYTIYPALEALHTPVHMISGLAYVYGLVLIPDGRVALFRHPSRWIKLVLLVYVIILPIIGLAFTYTDGEPAGMVMIFGLLIPIVGSIAQGVRYRTAQTETERQQSRVVLWALAIAFGLALLLVPIMTTLEAGWTVAFEPWQEFSRLVFLVFPPLFAIIPVTLTVAILRYRLWDVDLILHRTLVYGLLSAIVIGIYVVVVGGLGAVFQASGSLVISLLATGLVAVLFQPLRERLQRWVNRLVYGDRDDPYAVLGRLGERLAATLAPDAVLPTIVETIQETLKLPEVAIELASETYLTPRSPSVRGKGESDPPPFLGAGSRPALGLKTRSHRVRLPLTYRGELVGHLVVGPHASGEPLSPADYRLLESIARHAGVAAHAVRLTQDLQSARERLVSAREEERRRLRRDLHDGLGPTLATLALQADAARDVVRLDPTQADSLLVEMTGQAQSAVADIRRLVYDLRPPALDDLGLLGAIQLQAGQLSHAGFQVRVETPPTLPALPAAVEVAAYRIIQEALTNVVRHAQASVCTVRLVLAEADLLVTVADNGRGLPAAHRTGVGLASMRERAAELGGTLEAGTPSEGGTTVQARLPLISGSPSPLVGEGGGG